MRASHYRYFASRVQLQCTTLLYQHLHPRDFSKRCDAWMALSCLVLIDVARLSLSAVAALRGVCSRETLRQALLALLPDYQESLRRAGTLLRKSLPQGLRKRRRSQRRRRYPLAVDLHGVPYYKRHRPPPEQVRKGKRQPGTSYSHQYATAALLHKGRYYTVAFTVFAPGEDMASVLKRLLQQAAANGFSPRYVLMDRGFWSTDVFRYLQRARYPFLIPVQPGGKKPTATRGATGTRAFLYDCPSGWYIYRVVRRGRQRSVRVHIGVQRHNYGGYRGRHGRYNWAYAGWRVPTRKVGWLQQCHRKRFRIESSYRLLEAARGRTSSRDEKLRLWYVLVAIVLLNRWLELRQEDSKRGTVLQAWWNRVLTALAFLLLQECRGSKALASSTKVPLVE